MSEFCFHSQPLFLFGLSAVIIYCVMDWNKSLWCNISFQVQEGFNIFLHEAPVIMWGGMMCLGCYPLWIRLPPFNYFLVGSEGFEVTKKGVCGFVGLFWWSDNLIIKKAFFMQNVSLSTTRNSCSPEDEPHYPEVSTVFILSKNIASTLGWMDCHEIWRWWSSDFASSAIIRSKFYLFVQYFDFIKWIPSASALLRVWC